MRSLTVLLCLYIYTWILCYTTIKIWSLLQIIINTYASLHANTEISISWAYLVLFIFSRIVSEVTSRHTFIIKIIHYLIFSTYFHNIGWALQFRVNSQTCNILYNDRVALCKGENETFIKRSDSGEFINRSNNIWLKPQSPSPIWCNGSWLSARIKEIMLWYLV